MAPVMCGNIDRFSFLQSRAVRNVRKSPAAPPLCTGMNANERELAEFCMISDTLLCPFPSFQPVYFLASVYPVAAGKAAILPMIAPKSHLPVLCAAPTAATGFPIWRRPRSAGGARRWTRTFGVPRGQRIGRGRAWAARSQGRTQGPGARHRPPHPVREDAAKLARTATSPPPAPPRCYFRSRGRPGNDATASWRYSGYSPS
jgi:hypothetical protein